MKNLIWAPVLAICLGAGVLSARAFDCAKAYLSVDFVICSNPTTPMKGPGTTHALGSLTPKSRNSWPTSADG